MSSDNTAKRKLIGENTVRKQLDELSAALSKPALREDVLRTLATYSRYSRTELVDKFSFLQQDLGVLLSPGAVSALLNLLNLENEAIKKAVEGIQNVESKQMLQKINALYRPLFEGFLSPFRDDWYRVFWQVKYELASKTPLLYIKVYKRSGETFFFESPFSAVLQLVIHLLRQIEGSAGYLRKIGTPLDLSNQLTEIRKIADGLLTSG